MKNRGMTPRASGAKRDWSGIELLEKRSLLSASVDAGSLSVVPHDADRILVHFKDPGTAAPAATRGTKLGNRVGRDRGLLEVTLDPGVSVADALAAYRKNPLVDYAEPNWIYTTTAVSNDPSYTNGSLWGMYGDTTAPASTYGSQAAEAWAAGTTGSKDVYVGIIDEGVQWNHPDLAGNAWTNPFEPVDGKDNDGNGYVDDVHGWDFYNRDSSTYDGTADDHGTHVAGTIAGVGGNGIGVAGVNWNVTFISAKFLGQRGGSTADAIAAIDYFVDLKARHGLNIVALNNSWGGGGYSQGLLDAITRAAKAGILFVASAGNGGTDQIGDNNDTLPSYPAGYNTTTGAGYDSVISVAAIGSNGSLGSFSNYGATSVDLAAPGVSIYSTLPGNGYGTKSGTSMAAPHVTGAAALYASANPGASADAIRRAILDGARLTPTASVSSRTATGGRLDVTRTLAQSPVPVAPAAPTGLTATAASSSQITLTWTDNALNESGFTIERQNGDLTFTVVGQVAANVTTWTESPGTLAESTEYTYRLSAYNGVGSTFADPATAAATTKAASAAPNAPSDLRAVAPSDTTVNLSWADNASDETGFVIQRALAPFPTDGSTPPGYALIQVGANVTSYPDGQRAAGTTYYYRVAARGESRNSDPTATVAVTTAARLGTGAGLTGKYYDYSSTTPTIPPSNAVAFNKLVLTRTDPTVNFDWGTGSPQRKISNDTFAVRWTGQVETRYATEYVFSVEADDGIRVWVDGQLVLDYWFSQWVKRDSTPVALTAGRHDIQIDYFEGNQGARLMLYWSAPGAGLAKEIIPQSQLYANTGAGTPIYSPTSGGDAASTAVSEADSRTALAGPLAVPAVFSKTGVRDLIEDLFA
jgi:subtilisin family serine protease